MRPSSSALASITSASLRSADMRSPGVVSNQVSSNAFLAAATARSTSSSPPLGTSAIVSPVEGLITCSVSPLAASTHSPPMYICLVFTAVAMGPPPSRAPLVMNVRIASSMPPGAVSAPIAVPAKPGRGTVQSVLSPRLTRSAVDLRREELPRAKREPELHPVERGRQVATRELLHLPHPVAERVTVDVERRRGRLPPRIVREEGSKRGRELAAVVAVVGVERREERFGERPQRVGLAHRQQQAVRPEVLEACRGPPLQPADLEGVARLAETPGDVADGDDAARSRANLRAQTLRQRLEDPVEVALRIGLQQDVRSGRCRRDEETAARAGEKVLRRPRQLLVQSQLRLRVGAGLERVHLHVGALGEPEPRELARRVGGRDVSAYERLEEVSLQAALRVGDGARLGELDRHEGQRVTGHDAVELCQRLGLPDREEGFHPALGADGLDPDVMAAVDEREAE